MRYGHRWPKPSFNGRCYQPAGNFARNYSYAESGIAFQALPDFPPSQGYVECTTDLILHGRAKYNKEGELFR